MISASLRIPVRIRKERFSGETYRKKHKHASKQSLDSVDYEKVTRLSYAAVDKTHAQ